MLLKCNKTLHSTKFGSSNEQKSILIERFQRLASAQLRPIEIASEQLIDVLCEQFSLLRLRPSHCRQYELHDNKARLINLCSYPKFKIRVHYRLKTF